MPKSAFELLFTECEYQDMPRKLAEDLVKWAEGIDHYNADNPPILVDEILPDES
jgi:hypothetical protein